MLDELQNFLEAPGARTYRKVREALVDEVASQGLADSLSPTALIELTALAAGAQFEEILDRVDELQPAWALSPRVHYLAAVAAEETGEDDLAQLERFTFQACLEGILATGNGTAESPYLITYLSDAYDVLGVLGLDPRSQALVDRQGTLCDVVKCLDGEEVWFDLTGVLYDPRERRVEIGTLQGVRF